MSLFCWGDPLSGGGTGLVPTVVPSTHTYGFLDASNSSNAATRTGGAVDCWGQNSQGELGDGNNTASPLTIVQATGISTVVKTASGNKMLIALLSNGTVVVWGSNYTSTPSTPAALAGITNAIDVAAGAGSMYCLLADGRVLAWGGNGNGQLGQGTFGGPAFNPTPQFVTGVLTVPNVLSSNDAYYTPSVGGWSWTNTNPSFAVLPPPYAGEPGAGVLSLPATAPGNMSAVLPNNVYPVTPGLKYTGTTNFLPLTTFRTVAVFLAWYTAGGALISLVSNAATEASFTNWTTVSVSATAPPTAAFAQLQYQVQGCAGGEVHFQSTNTLAPAVVALSGGVAFWMALLSNGTLLGCGNNSFGELGDGTVTNRPTPVAAIQTGVAQVSAGGQGKNDGHTLALLTNGEVVGWGNNTWGQLGNNQALQAPNNLSSSSLTQLTPVQALGLGGVTITDVSAGGTHSMALDSAGDLYMWGANAFGQLGDGTVACKALPFKLQTGVLLMSAGSKHSASWTG